MGTPLAAVWRPRELTLERPEATPGICKPVDWGSAGPKIASACAGRRQPSDAAWGMFLLEWAS